MYISGAKKLFQWPTEMNRNSVANIGSDSGRYSTARMRKWPAPSIFADSRSESGICSNWVRAMIRWNTAIAPGTASAHTVSMKPSPRTTRNSGMKPPEKNMVTTNSSVITRRP